VASYILLLQCSPLCTTLLQLGFQYHSLGSLSLTTKWLEQFALTLSDVKWLHTDRSAGRTQTE
jgi:hypothetical protein